MPKSVKKFNRRKQNCENCENRPSKIHFFRVIEILKNDDVVKIAYCEKVRRSSKIVELYKSKKNLNCQNTETMSKVQKYEDLKKQLNCDRSGTNIIKK